MVHAFADVEADRGGAFGARRVEEAAELDRALAELLELTHDASGATWTLDATTVDLPGAHGLPPSRWTVLTVCSGATAETAARIVAEANAPRSALRRLRASGAFVALRGRDDGYAIALYLPWIGGRPPHGM